MNKFHEVLTEQLSRESSFINDNGELKKFIIIDAAYNINHRLIELLIEIDEIKNKFFTEIKGHWVFNINLFVQYMENKNFLKDSYTRYKNKIGLNINGKFLNQRNEVSLVWPFKDCVLEGGQTTEDQKRSEIFFNELLAQEEIDQLFEPKVLTNWKRYTTDGKEKVTKLKTDIKGNLKENLIIKGNNLLALHSLLPRFEEKVKLIYIDPPYNTGNDSFGYNDNFNHSTWLTFMKNRLDVAKRLLRKNGVLIVHCDFIEDSYLKILMDDIFGRNNFINHIAIKDSHPSGLKMSARNKTIIKTKSTMIVYKNSDKIKINPIYQKRQIWDTHFNTFVDINDKLLPKYSLKEYIEKNEICDQSFQLNRYALENEDFLKFALANRNKIFQSTKEIPKNAKDLSKKNWDNVIQYKKGEFAFNGRRLSPLNKSIYNVGFDKYIIEYFGKLICDFWDDVDFNNSQNEGGVSFPSGKKPELLLARLISMFTEENDIVLDYHLGSGTTSAVSHKLGRQYIGIEQLDYGKNDSTIRMQNVIGKKIKKDGEWIDTIDCDKSGISKAVNWQGGGDFIYCELKKYNQTFIEQIEFTKDSKELLKIWEEMKERSFINYNVDIKKQDEEIEEFKKLTLKQQKEILLHILNKNQLYVNLSSIDDDDFKVSDEDKKLTKEFYEIEKEQESTQMETGLQL
ncbi:MAG: site-specific DNA-methyltransferase [Candidatus Tenebribacter burtonii]|nr:site-specific DNA-methyltransferase [Candidatus Tenebribacter burtonii]